MDFAYLNDGYSANGGTLIMLAGPPGSGKTTVAHKIVDTLDNYVIVSPDDIREDMFGSGYNQTQNDSVFNKVYSDLIKNLDAGYNVVYDATNCRSNYRTKIIDICRDHTYRMICLISSKSLSQCVKQNESRNNSVPEVMVESMYFTLRKHPPTIFEGFDLIGKF